MSQPYDIAYMPGGLTVLQNGFNGRIQNYQLQNSANGGPYAVQGSGSGQQAGTIVNIAPHSIGATELGANAIASAAIGANAVGNSQINPTVVQSYTASFNKAQMANITANNLTVAAAPGANTAYVPYAFTLQLKPGTNPVAFTGGNNVSLAAGGTTLCTGGITAATVNANTTNGNSAVPVAFQLQTNAALVLNCNAAFAGGGANDAVVATVWAAVVPTV